jgi:hypothetical protein
LPNFSTVSNSTLATTILQGAAGKRILILANLRSQKIIFSNPTRNSIKISHPDWTFHLVGKDFKDEYATQINQAIKQHNLGETIFMYGSKEMFEYIESKYHWYFNLCF